MQSYVANNILNMMCMHLNSDQMLMLQTALNVTLSNYIITKKQNELVALDDDWKNDLRDFLLMKQIEGKSQRTLKQYKYQLFKLLSHTNKKLNNLTSSDIYNYMMRYKAVRKVSNRTLENMRLIFSSFFNWAFSNKRISENPILVLSRIKYDYTIKQPFSNEELEQIACCTNNERDSSLVEFLYSSCVRVSELVELNRDDVKFSEKELTVFGKGGKERIVYINAKAYVHLKKYLSERTDNNPALFVSLNRPHNRLSVSGVESALRRIGKRAGISKVHPHRFRRTGATNALNRGMPVEEVSSLLGHNNISTTQIYCTISQGNIKMSHSKYLNG